MFIVNIGTYSAIRDGKLAMLKPLYFVDTVFCLY